VGATAYGNMLAAFFTNEIRKGTAATMRVVTNEKLISRNKQIAQVLFFVSLAVLAGSFFFSSNIDEDVALYFQCLVLPTMLLLVMLSVRMTNQWVRQPFPWIAIREGLKGVGPESVMYSFLLPAPYVIVSPQGIFAIVSRFQDRPQKVVDDKWQTSFSILAFMRQEQLGNPSHEARLKAKQTEAFLQELLGDDSIQVQPVVVFHHPNAEVVMEGKQTVPVLYASTEKKKDTLKQYLKDAKKQGFPTLSKDQLEELDNVLLYKD
jgi:hypothetical protein